ncbi:hypothetical protein [Pleomorphomonas sp. NRK KF1]|uniref:hypothetical protein n=1 Tax=Pleomorphomonas sp. NRK KF1 TaxID=2943000 RepID=UPI002043A246|nr:hypothetical protein [Pleomorphomonas sp. NRK KF1]MCM5555156.1 hypothetical protein [Pleomorphomonas sp. NRK KF1]
MAYGKDKYRSRRNRARVRDLLMREWDPIGVFGIEEASDEYDAYVGSVYVMAMDERAAAHDIAAFLLDIETRHMGLAPGDQARARRVAEMLVAMVPQFEAEPDEPS